MAYVNGRRLVEQALLSRCLVHALGQIPADNRGQGYNFAFNILNDHHLQTLLSVNDRKRFMQLQRRCEDSAVKLANAFVSEGWALNAALTALLDFVPTLVNAGFVQVPQEYLDVVQAMKVSFIGQAENALTDTERFSNIKFIFDLLHQEGYYHDKRWVPTIH